MNSSHWKKQETVIAIFNKESKEWQYATFDTWEEAREVINSARKEGKAAVFYDGATLLEPPNFFIKSDTPLD